MFSNICCFYCLRPYPNDSNVFLHFFLLTYFSLNVDCSENINVASLPLQVTQFDIQYVRILHINQPPNTDITVQLPVCTIRFLKCGHPGPLYTAIFALQGRCLLNVIL